MLIIPIYAHAGTFQMPLLCMQPLRMLMMSECGEACNAVANEFKRRTGYDFEFT